MSEQPIDRLKAIMARLRDPETGCPWDLQQDSKSLMPYTLEEAYEVVEAIELGDPTHLKEELGDLLLQVMFHSQIAAENHQFSFDDVVDQLCEKMVRRHPHVFAGKVFASEDERKFAWEEAKRVEREAKQAQQKTLKKDTAEFKSRLAHISLAQPALLSADQIQSTAARYGFDWQEVAPVYDKVDEELAEIKDAVAKGDAEHIKEEVGDLIFVAVNLARHLGVNSETALRAANAKFASRFNYIEQQLFKQQRNMEECELAELDDLWDEAKIKLKKPHH